MATKKATSAETKKNSPKRKKPAEEEVSPERNLKEPAISPEKKGIEFHGFTFSSTLIEEAVFAHIVRRIDQIQFPKLSYSHIRGAVHSWVSGAAIDAVILTLLTNGIMEKTDYKGRPALQFKDRALRKYPVKKLSEENKAGA